MRIILIDTNHPVLQQTLEEHGHVCDPSYKESYDEVLARIHLYDGIVIRSRFRIDRQLMDAAKNLKFIARAGAGMENIDVAYAEQKGISCLHAPEGNRDAVAEHALGMLLSLFNNLNRADRQVRSGEWIREGNRGVELMGKTVGIIGYGNMGMAFAERLSGFGVKVLAYDKYKAGFGGPHVTESDLQGIFDEADILSLHVPLTPETHYMVNRQFLSSFLKPIYIINTARGKCLNTHDLVEAMDSGKVLGACLDVLEYEASSFERIALDLIPAPLRQLFRSDKVIFSPHVAGWTHESNEKIARVLAEKIILAGK